MGQNTSRPEAGRIRLVHLTTVPQSLIFLKGQIRYMADHGLDVCVISSPGAMLDKFGVDERVRVFPVTMRRRITPLADILTLFRLTRLLRRLKPEIVHAHTPKAGLLGMVAATLAQVPIRIYHIHGLPFETALGLRRRLLLASEWLSCRCAHQVLCVSPSVLMIAERAGVCASGHGKVLLSGSINGVDATGEYDPDRLLEEGAATRRRLNIPENDLVIGYVGRIVAEKGVGQLVEAWKVLHRTHNGLRLLVVGDTEEQDPLPDQILQALIQEEDVHLVGWVDNPANYYMTMNVLALPSHREGFGLTVIEAASMRLPVVASRIAGVVDAVSEGLTGLLVESKDVEGLTLALDTYLSDPALRHAHGEAGRQRTLELFDQRQMWSALLSNYASLLALRMSPAPRTANSVDQPIVSPTQVDTFASEAIERPAGPTARVTQLPPCLDGQVRT